MQRFQIGQQTRKVGSDEIGAFSLAQVPPFGEAALGIRIDEAVVLVIFLSSNAPVESAIRSCLQPVGRYKGSILESQNERRRQQLNAWHRARDRL